jgi:hypothetical protein
MLTGNQIPTFQSTVLPWSSVDVFDTEDEGRTVLRNIEGRLPVDTA